MSSSLLSEAQRRDLHRALASYLAAEPGVSADLVEQLRRELRVEAAAPPDAGTLERKWIALVRLQRKLMETEEQNVALRAELKEARAALARAGSGAGAGAGAINNWLPRWPPRHRLLGHRARVTCVAFHPEWSLLASGSDDGSIKIWDFEQGEIEQTLRAHTRGVQSLAFAPHSKLLVSCSADLSVRVWDPAKRFANTLTLVGHDHTVSAVAVAVDPRTSKEYVVSGSRDKTIRVWDLATGFAVRVMRPHTDWVRTLSVTGAHGRARDGNAAAATAITASGGGAEQAGQPAATQPPGLDAAETGAEYLVSAGSDRVVCLEPLLEDMDDVLGSGLGSGLGGGLGSERGGDRALRFEGHTNVIECCAVAPPTAVRFVSKHYTAQRGDIVFASGGRDCAILVWASSHAEGPVLRLVGHDNWVRGLAFHPSGRFLVSVSDDKTMRIWDLAAGKLAKTINAHDHFVTSIAWRGRAIATGSVDLSVRVW